MYVSVFIDCSYLNVFLLPCLQLLDCFVVPVLMILSWWILKTRYRPVHYVAVCVCVLGVGAMVGADLLAGRDQGSSKNFFKCYSLTEVINATEYYLFRK